MGMDSTLDLIDRLARQQDGVVSAKQLKTGGLSPRQVSYQVERGQLIAITKGVYRVAGAPRSDRALLRSACLVNDRFSFVSHRSAAHRFYGADLGSDEENEILEVTAPRSSSARTLDVTVHRPWRVDEAHIWTRDDFRVTSPMRTMVDLGSVVDKAVLVSVTEQLLIRRMVTVSLLRWGAEALRNPMRPGAELLLEVLDERKLGVTVADSVLELAFHDVCGAIGEPGWVFQFPVVIHGKKYRIDFAFPMLKLAFEVVGWANHMEWDRFNHDRVRASDLMLHGWRVVELTYDQIMEDPGYTMTTVLAHIDHRRHELDNSSGCLPLGA